MKIRDTSQTQPKILDTSKQQPRIDPEEVAKALGAEPMTRPPFVFANYPEAPELRQALHAKMSKEKSLALTNEEWEQLVTLAQELSAEEKKHTPQEVGHELLRLALQTVLQGKLALKASLEHKHTAQAAE